jgi:hypothetical protein
MNTLLAFLAKIFAPVEAIVVADIAKVEAEAITVAAKVGAAFAAIVGQQPAAQQQILHDSMATFTADITAGKDAGTAAADALMTFYNEEKADVQAATKSLFQAFLQSVGVS